MKLFYIKMQFDTKLQEWYVQYFYNTDCRTETTTKELPIEAIIKWCRE